MKTYFNSPVKLTDDFIFSAKSSQQRHQNDVNAVFCCSVFEIQIKALHEESKGNILLFNSLIFFPKLVILRETIIYCLQGSGSEHIQTIDGPHNTSNQQQQPTYVLLQAPDSNENGEYCFPYSGQTGWE